MISLDKILLLSLRDGFFIDNTIGWASSEHDDTDLK